MADSNGPLPPGISGTPNVSGQDPNLSWLTNNMFTQFVGSVAAIDKWDIDYLWNQTLGSPDQQLYGYVFRKIQDTSPSMDDEQKNQAAWQAVQKAQSDPAYRTRLAAWLGWNKDNPQVQQWVRQGGSTPSDPTTAGKPIAGPQGGPGTGVTGTGANPNDPSAATVQDPFPSQYFNNPNYQGNNYGDPKPDGVNWGGWQWHQGQDYGVPQGTPLSFPFAGKVVQVGYDPGGYGNYVTVEFGDQGLRMTYAHLSYVQVQQGETLNPGQDVGFSGGEGPGSGISTGAHLLVVLQDAHGNPIDPRPLLTAIYGGATLGQLQKLGVGQTGTTGASGSYTTPDGHVIYPGTADDAAYSMIAAPYEHYYGTKPPWALAVALKSQGVTNTDQMAAIAASWPSDIPGISFGTRENIYNQANAIAMKNYGRPIPDSLVKQLALSGNYSNDAIKEWFDTHVPSEMPPDDYKMLYDQVNPMFQSTYGTGPSPDYIGYLWGKTQPSAVSATGTTPATTPPTTTQTPPAG